MLHNFRLALSCLLIVCILLAGCTAPGVDEGAAQTIGSQKELETANVTENKTKLPPVEQAPLQPEEQPEPSKPEEPNKPAPEQTPQEEPATPQTPETAAPVPDISAPKPEVEQISEDEAVTQVHTAGTKQNPTGELRTNPNTGATATQTKTAAPNVLVPSSPGTVAFTNSNTTIDASNAAQGYVMVKYTGSNPKVKLQITRSGNSTCTFNLLARGSYEVFPLSMGDGSYTIALFENAGGNQYAPGLSKTIQVKLANGFSPFLYPNQFVNFNAKTTVVGTATTLAQAAVSDLDFVEKVYKYTMDSIYYDDVRAATVGTSPYLPNLNSVIQEGKGICFDYAAIMSAMLRSQGIPTRLEVGYAANQRHAWISTYITNVGWINNIISFDGKSWRRLDPTFADQGSEAYTAQDANYQIQYYY